MSLFCCARPRSYSPPATGCTHASSDAATSVKPFSFPRRSKQGHRQPMQDVEGPSGREGEQLQQNGVLYNEPHVKPPRPEVSEPLMCSTPHMQQDSAVTRPPSLPLDLDDDCMGSLEDEHASSGFIEAKRSFGDANGAIGNVARENPSLTSHAQRPCGNPDEKDHISAQAVSTIPSGLKRDAPLLTTIYNSGLSSFFQSIPKLVEPSFNSMNTASTSAPESYWTVMAKSPNDSYLLRTPTADRTGGHDSSPCGEFSGPDFLAGGGVRRVHIDSSSSYYTSQISSPKSSIDLLAFPMPPPPTGGAMINTRRETEHSHSTFFPPVSWDTPLSRANSDLSLQEFHARPNKSRKELVLNNTSTRSISSSGIADGNVYFIQKTGAPDEASNVSGTNIGMSTSLDDVSGSESGNTSSIWGICSSSKPLLSAAYGGAWDSIRNSSPHESRVSTIGKQRHGTSSENLHHWLDDRHEASTDEQLKFSKTLSKNFSKLKSRLTGTLKATQMTQSAAKRAFSDGRGNFSRLYAPSDSLETEGKTTVGNSDRGIPLDTDIVFYTSATPEAQGTNCQPEVSGKQESITEIEVLSSGSQFSREATGRDVSIDEACETTQESSRIAHPHRYSAVYDDCVVFPFAQEGDDPEDSNTGITLNGLGINDLVPGSSD